MTNGKDFEELARRLLRRYADTSTDPKRLDTGQSNMVWGTDHAVLRMSASPESRDLLREARLAELLPPEVGYPVVIGSGIEEDLEWVVAERIEGEPLEDKWPELSDATRIQAIEKLWERLQWVHKTDAAQARAIGCTQTPFYALTEKLAFEQVNELARRKVLDRQKEEKVREILSRAFPAMKEVPEALGHTDAGLHNTLWNGSDATLLDFEFACVAPFDLDLEMLVRQLASPGPGTVLKKLMELADEHMRNPRSRDRLIGYAVLRDVWALLLWLRYADSYGPGRAWPPQEVVEWDPWIRLTDHAQGKSVVFQL